jgi:beta-phosphoglucomutase
MAFRAIISDLDGVIVDTVPQHFESWQRMFAEFGVDFSFEDYKEKIDGIPRIDGVRRILAGASEKEIEKACARKQELFLELIEGGVNPYPTTVALFRDFQVRGIRLAAISSSKNCETILRSIDLYRIFTAVITGNDITKGKPDPQIFLMAAEALSLEPAECVVFEDAALGVEAAKLGRFPCVGIDRHGTPDRLAAADLVVSDLGEVDFETLAKLCSGRSLPDL